MNTFKKATKRITAVAASAALVSSAVFGAGLSAYPSNFVKSGEFDGTVVIGATADSAAATSIISDLASELSGDSEKVKITAKMTSTDGGDIVSAIKEKSSLNYGDSFTDLIEELDEDSTDLLADGSVDNEDYTQTLTLVAADADSEFNYKYFKEVKGETEAAEGLFFKDGATFATYTLDLTELGDISTSDVQKDVEGEELTIMGNEFTIVDIDTNKLELIGGANKVSLGEGETSSVSIDGVSYEVEIQSVSGTGNDAKILLTINGESKSIDLNDVEEVAGISVAVTEIVSSNRDSVKGYASLVVGGQKLSFGSSSIEINDESVDDLYDDYKVDTTWSAKVLTINYRTDVDVLLEEGDSLNDVLFGAFTLSYDGTNEVEYSTVEITSTTDSVEFSGNLYNGKAIPSEFMISAIDSLDIPASLDNFQLGAEDTRIIFTGSDLATAGAGVTVSELDNSLDLLNHTVSGTVTFDLGLSTTDLDDLMFFTLEGKKEDMHLFQVSSSDEDKEGKSVISFDDILKSSMNGDDLEAADIKDKLDSVTFDAAGKTVSVDVSELSELSGEVTVGAKKSALYLENELMMNFEAAEAATNQLVFSYSSDADSDESATLTTTFTVQYDQHNTEAKSEDIALSISAGMSLADMGKSSDYQLGVDKYGTRVIVNDEDDNSVKIMVPSEEVVGKVSFNFGAAGSSVETYTVDADMADAKVAELEEAGYTVSTEKVSSEAVEFDITAPVMASEVSGTEDMIVVGGPAVNAVAASLLGEGVVGVEEGEAVVRYFADVNSVLVYGYDLAGTTAAAAKLNAGGLTGSEVKVNE